MRGMPICWMFSVALVFLSAGATQSAESTEELKAKRLELARVKQSLALQLSKMELMLKELRAEGKQAEASAVARRIEELRLKADQFAAQEAALRDRVEAGEAWKDEIIQKLQRKVSFEFVDTPFTEAATFLQTLTKANFVLDPTARDHPPALSLRVTDMSMESALRLMCKVSRMKYELQDGAIYISRIEEAPPMRPETKIPATAKLRVRLADGREIEADGSIFAARPDLLERIINKFMEEDEAPTDQQAKLDVQGTLEPTQEAGAYMVKFNIRDLTDPKAPKQLAAPRLVILKDKVGSIEMGDGRDKVSCRVHVVEGNQVAAYATVRVVKEGKLIARRDIVMPLVKTVQKGAGKPPAPPDARNQF